MRPGARSAVLRDAAALVRAGLLAPEAIARVEAAAHHYAVAVTPEIAALIDASDPADPIARQFLPDPRELDVTKDELSDPIGDDAHSPCEGIVHRYPDRVLLKLVQVCAVYCRFCFRREMVGPGQSNALSPQALGQALDYIAARREIWEVILTGGDPLTASPRRLADVAARLAAIPHVKILRIHSRVPVADPAKITPALIEALRASGKTVYVAIHANHPREFTPAMTAACAFMSAAGFVLVSQSVLLKDVNDEAVILADLMRGFVERRIKPYYLHHPDLARGTSHFRVPLARGQELMRALRGTLSGLCQPAYMLDIPGGHGKVPVGPVFAQARENGTMVTDFRGGDHFYAPD